ncbi:MAG: MFS transporter [Candidatus Bathyarchaeota archaeon]|nr:MFS transporter [Candidatus Bathyarchaeota archaeon]
MISGQRDVNLLILMRGLRGFGYGFLNTALGIYLVQLGYSLLQVGLVVTVAGVSSAILIVSAGLLSYKANNRKIFLILSALLMSALGAIYVSTASFPLLLLGAVLGGAGSAGAGGPGGGPFGPAQQALLADKVSAIERNRVFSINALVGTLLFSLGAAFAALPETFSALGLDRILVYRLLFLIFMGLGLVTAFLSYVVQDVMIEKRKTIDQEKRLIGKFTLTATLNGFGFGLIPLPLITLWFSIVFGASAFYISLVISASTIASAFSYLFAPSLAKRLGSVKMIVSTRLVSAVLLVLLPIIPFFVVASIFYVARSIFLSVGMPIRQSYMMGIVGAEERAMAVGVSSGLGWGLPYAVSPVFSGYIMQEVASSLPLYISALLQTANSAVYYLFFHGLKPPEESANKSL